MNKEKYPWRYFIVIAIDIALFALQCWIFLKPFISWCQIDILKDDLMNRYGTELIVLAMVMEYRDRTIFTNNPKTAIYKSIMNGEFTDELFFPIMIKLRRAAVESIFWFMLSGTVFVFLGSI